METTYFNTAVDRRGTNCIKWDAQSDDCGREGLLPFFIADADYRTAPCVIDTLEQRVLHGVFGYSVPGPGYFRAVVNWFRKRHDLELKEEWITPTEGIVPSISHAIMLFTDPGAGVVVQPPVYDPFYSVVKANGRSLLLNDLVRKQDTYEMDFDDLEEKFRGGAQMLILCNPHNPVGRVWRQDELERCAELCARYHVTLVSDEIHCDLTLDGNRHYSAGRLDAIRDRLVLCLSPSKSFNLAGLATSNIVIPDPQMRQKYQDWLYSRYMFSPNALGMVACQAAYEGGESWMDAQLAHLSSNYHLLRSMLEQRMPEVRLAKAEGTYLMWLDLTCFGLSSDQLAERLAGLGMAVNKGREYGAGYDGFLRMNIACPAAQLEKGISLLEELVRELRNN